MKVRICHNCRKPNLENAWNCSACGDSLSARALVEISNESTIKLLDNLRSEKVSTRNDAIEKIITEKINDEPIVLALKGIIENDTAESVRKYARSALDVFGDKTTPINSKGEPVKNWLFIGLFIGLIPGLGYFFLTINGQGLGVLNTICIGPVGILGGIIGASIGRGDKTNIWVASIIISILGAFLGLLLAAFTCLSCQ